jgi:enterochelin esterase-like enzyme
VDVADQEIRSGDIAPMIIIFPQGDDGFWTNHTGDGPRWGEYVVRDLVAHIDNTYRTLRSPAARAIGGLSMGGWGALHNAFLHPEVFGVVGAHSPSLRPDDGSLAFLGTGEEFASKDPISLARTQPGLDSLRIWIDSAQEDPWLDRDTLLHQILQDRGIEHIWQVYPGIHEWTYWHEHAIDYLRFYGNALARQ